MKIYTAEEAGFCFGVKRALSLIEQLYEKEENIEVYGQLIHNNTVLKNLEKKGINYIESLANLDKNKKLIIRTHGITLEEERYLKQNNVLYEDATCPLVKKIHTIIEKIDQSEHKIIIIGDKNHPEIKAIKSYSKNGIVINSIEDIKKIEKMKSVAIVAQTTLDTDFFKKMIAAILDKIERVEIFNTICDATKVRQEAVKKIAPKVDFVIVIGGKNSSNTKKLFHISKKINPNTFHIEKSSELENFELLNRFKLFNSVGITAGASTPPEELENVKIFFKNLKLDKEI
ncbi:MAG: 4-hydroxy-3-methylbut-2-enyl diphosphate reductase [Acidobacteriota bacterium]